MSISFPADFLWGASTAAHQIEGNNTAADHWEFENGPHATVEEPSGDACDSLHRWADDLDIVQSLGLNSYRFSIEWARIEPERGRVSRAMLAHYRRIIEGCLARNLTPIVTLHHFTSPRWFTAGGGWRSPDARALFANYVATVVPILDGVEWVCTINEPNMLAAVTALREHGTSLHDLLSSPGGLAAALTPELLNSLQAMTDGLVLAHAAAHDVMAEQTNIRSGWSVAHLVVEAEPGSEELARILSDTLVEQFIRPAAGDDYVGVQAYSRFVVGGAPKRSDAPLRRTMMGYEFHPDALGKAVRLTSSVLPGVPILVTENGIATGVDEDRVEYTTGALRSLHAAMADGIDVRGYLHWSLLDNYEWGTFRPTFGLVAVNRSTFERSIKQSGYWFGDVARTGEVAD